MSRLIWTGTVLLPDNTPAEVLVNVFRDEDPGVQPIVEVALRATSHDTWGPPAALIFQGTDDPKEARK